LPLPTPLLLCPRLQAKPQRVDEAWELFGLRVWTELRAKYGADKVAAFEPPGAARSSPGAGAGAGAGAAVSPVAAAARGSPVPPTGKDSPPAAPPPPE